MHRKKYHWSFSILLNCVFILFIIMIIHVLYLLPLASMKITFLPVTFLFSSPLEWSSWGLYPSHAQSILPDGKQIGKRVSVEVKWHVDRFPDHSIPKCSVEVLGFLNKNLFYRWAEINCLYTHTHCHYLCFVNFNIFCLSWLIYGNGPNPNEKNSLYPGLRWKNQGLDCTPLDLCSLKKK